MEEEKITVAKAEYDNTISFLERIKNDWNIFQDYLKRQNELDAEWEKQSKQRKTFMGFVELLVFVGVVALSVFSFIGFIVLVYFCIIGVSVSALPLILGLAAMMLFGFNIFQLIRHFQAGEWFNFGINLRKYKNGRIGFTKGRGLLLIAEPFKQTSEFRKGKIGTSFRQIGKGYHDASTGATIRLVNEGAQRDFDPQEEFKSSIEIAEHDMEDFGEERWFSGAIWTKINLPKLMMLMIIAIIVSGFAALMGMGSIALNYQTQDGLTKRINALDGNLTIKITDIQEKVSKQTNSPGVIT